jgi:YjbE family integral membrane protein
MLGELNSARFWFDLLQIIGINILLSGDNAVVIALASRSLPESQRKMAVLGGSGAAVVLRIALCLIVASLLQVRYLKMVGGLLLLYIGIKLIVEEESNDDIAARSNMWGAIRTILIADAVMSLDNVVAIAAAAHDSVLLIALGLLISIPLIVFGSQLMLKVLHRYPVLVMLGGGLLGWIAGEIIVSDPVVHGHLPFDEELVTRIAKPVLAIVVMLAGTALSKRAATVEQ